VDTGFAEDRAPILKNWRMILSAGRLYFTGSCAREVDPRCDFRGLPQRCRGSTMAEADLTEKRHIRYEHFQGVAWIGRSIVVCA
jgi:hypothetical protein